MFIHSGHKSLIAKAARRIGSVRSTAPAHVFFVEEIGSRPRTQARLALSRHRLSFR